VLFIANTWQGQFRYKLYVVHFLEFLLQTLPIFIFLLAPLGNPKEIEVLEFGEEELPVKLVVVQVMPQGAHGLREFVNGKKIHPVFLTQFDFQVVVDPEIQAQCMIELPTKLVVLYGGYDAQDAGILEKVFGGLLDV
jgi:hypothetical protein